MLGVGLALVLAGPVAARALDLALPGEAVLTHEEVSPADTYQLPVGPFDGDSVPVRAVEGRVTRQAWRIEATDLTTLQLISRLRAQLVERGHDVLFECAARECGGFDFRFDIGILPAPDMFVDLFDYRFLAARRGEGNEAEHVSILVSRAGAAGYVQLIVVGGSADPRVTAETGAAPAKAAPPAGTPGGTLVARLLSEGHVILPDLEFDTGASALAEGEYESLAALAAFLGAEEDRRIALVGHTDTVGGLEANFVLSRRRAASVLERLVEGYGVPRAQLESDGVGYLSPVAPNTTPEGREANRRVEAVLLSTE